MARAGCRRLLAVVGLNIVRGVASGGRRRCSSYAYASVVDSMIRGANSATSVSAASAAASRAATKFDRERERQRSLLSRVAKVEVRFLGAPQDCTMVMNRGISTPFDCARHMSENLMKRSVVAEVDGKIWDVHRPLEDNCVLRLISLDTPDKILPEANTAFWRSCSLVLAAVARNAFKDEVRVIPHSFPPPNVRSGSFVYDIVLDGLKSWNPTRDELRLLSAQMVKVARADHAFEYLKVQLPAALEIMADNPYKLSQLPQIAAANEGLVTLYKMGDYVDVSKGPMISRTSLLGRCTVTSVQRVENAASVDMYRFQGVALPNSILLNHFAYGLIEQRGRKFNPGRVPDVIAART